jgi:hypothetical protein
MSRVAPKNESPGYFEQMAAHYDGFVDQCILFKVPPVVATTMREMVIHIRMAARVIREQKKRKRR